MPAIPTPNTARANGSPLQSGGGQALQVNAETLVNTYTATKGQTFLAEALKKDMSDDDIVTALYERTLSRKPRDEEMAVCRRYIQKVGNRNEALEDIFWSVVNSTEFVTKR